MRFNTLILLSLTCVCLALAQTTYDDCCLKYVKELGKSTQRHAVDYRDQIPDGGCNIPAVIFTMKRGRKFCADPKQTWVKDLKKRIDKRRQEKPMKRHQRHRG
ncbi:hypothetical protein PBY51_021734 [Eleginops maclovinus]|uniref:Chemokine interleukin-8-like domain-containing protein n=1 Tax=Eleginops maclovinus TaxID=56733 RepID=A0AAN8AMF4_ELEMC|nr:hypothetical protein PBY51_021734 [Eleginops maclovinus]